MKLVHDLTEEELEELRSNYFYQLLDIDKEVLGDIGYSQEIPMANVIKHYEHIRFVEEDFFCNIKND